MFLNQVKTIVILSFFPFLKWLPSFKESRKEFRDLITGIIEKRKKEISQGIVKMDLLQVLMEANLEDPITLPDDSMREELMLLM